MKDAVFILFVVLVLSGLTALRYRKQIAGMIGVARMLRESKQSVGQGQGSFTDKSIPLVNCSKCGVWVPQNKSRKVGDVFFCSDACLKTTKA